jgi:hypothetical protein
MSRSSLYKALLSVLYFAVTLFSLASKATPIENKASDSQESIQTLPARPLVDTSINKEATHYIVSIGDTKVNADPIPNYVPFWLLQYRGEILVKRYLQFKGWDYNKDGLIDQLIELNDHGETIGAYYDFDFDGNIDDSEKLLSMP